MAALQQRRVWLGGGALAAVLIVAIAWLALIGPELASAHSLRDQTSATRQQNDLLGTQLDVLRTKKQHLTTYIGKLARSLEALPPSSGLPALTREVYAHASAARVTVTSVTVGSPTVVTPLVASSPAGGSTSSTAPSDTTTATTPAAGATTPATAAGSVYAIPVTLVSIGSLPRQLAFLQRLRLIGPRSVLIGSTQLTPGGATGGSGTATTPSSTSIDRASSLNTQLTVYSAPQAPAQIAQLDKLLEGKIGN